MFKCPKCGKEIKGFREICVYCGAKIESAQQSKEPPEGAASEPNDIKSKILGAFDIEELDVNRSPGGSKSAKQVLPQAELPKYFPADYFEDDMFAGRGWEKWNEVAALLYRDKVISDESEVEAFLQALQEWMKKVDPHNYKKMFSKIKVGRVAEYPFYCAVLSTLLEKRDDITEFQRPYNNEKIYKKTIQSPEQANLWDYKSTDDLYFLGSQQVFDIPDSMEVTICSACGGKKGKCSHCGGAGKITCPDCQGSGKVRCKACRGSLKKICFECRGKGVVAGEKCQKCGGTGGEKCDECDNGTLGCLRCLGKGKTLCANCNGTGAEYCKICHGSGRMLKGLQFSSVFKLHAEDAFFDNKEVPGAVYSPGRGLCQKENLAAEVAVKKIDNYEFLEGVQYAALKMKIASLVQNSYKQMADLSKIRRQKLQIYKYPVWLMDYSYEGKNYKIFFKSADLSVSFLDSPFDGLARNSLIRAKRCLYRLDFKNAVLAAERSKMFDKYAGSAEKIISAAGLLFNVVYFIDGLLGAFAGAMLGILFIMPSVKMTFNPVAPVIVFLAASAVIGLVITAVSRMFVNLKFSSFKLILLLPFALAFSGVLSASYLVFKMNGFNPYSYLDQKHFEAEYGKRFPYGVPSVFNAEDYNSLLSMRARFKDFDIDKSKIDNGIKLQERLMEKSLQEKRSSKTEKSKNAVKNAKPRSAKSEQNLELKWLKKNPKTRK